jgi:2-polyprenyl-3-methyl-5-hydroxy-6-metoxy-1,4-benzoquinol methylase
MIYQSPENSHSHCTAIRRKQASFPTRYLWEKGLIAGKVLDFGCGHGQDVRFLLEKGLQVKGYDPHYEPEWPREKYDTVLCHYVLNVLLPEEREAVLETIPHLLKKGGKAFLSVRRDLKKEGFRWHPIHKVNTFQARVILPFASLKRNGHCEIYAFS